MKIFSILLLMAIFVASVGTIALGQHVLDNLPETNTGLMTMCAVLAHLVGGYAGTDAMFKLWKEVK